MRKLQPFERHRIKEQVVVLRKEGLNEKEIAERLKCSTRTINNIAGPAGRKFTKREVSAELSTIPTISDDLAWRAKEPRDREEEEEISRATGEVARRIKEHNLSRLRDEEP